MTVKQFSIVLLLTAVLPACAAPAGSTTLADGTVACRIDCDSIDIRYSA